MAHSRAVHETIQLLQARVSMLQLNKYPHVNTQTRLNANLGTVRVDDRHYTLLGSGDDGDVILAESETEKYVLKVYQRIIITDDINPETVEADQKEMDEIVADQALREFKALRSMRGHPNVSRLISTEVDTCNMHLNGVDFPGSLLVRMEYIPHAITLSDIFSGYNHVDMATLGIVKSMRGPHESFHIDFNDRVKLIEYLFGQCSSVSGELRMQGIYHRDCASCNIVISFPSLRLVLLDFARAEVPGMKRIRDIISKNSSQKIKDIKQKRYHNYNDATDSDYVSMFSILEHIIKKNCNEGFFKNYTKEKKAIGMMINALKEKPLQYDVCEPPIEELKRFQEVWVTYTTQGTWRVEDLDDAVNSTQLLQYIKTEDNDKKSDEDEDDFSDDDKDIDPPDKLSPPRKIAKS